MGKIVSNFFISLDGVVEAPNAWHCSYFDDQMGASIGTGMATAWAFLMGRKPYEEWSEYWTTSTDDPDLAVYFNNIRKYVVSSTLEKADWNNTTVISGQGQRFFEDTATHPLKLVSPRHPKPACSTSPTSQTPPNWMDIADALSPR
ncbi:dihydrofolate reductase family protein [Qaidamihabitans albus]|uniref:dihydrofolate reductase family protein n=1 Tax=Qaidamihabitans albus TaxID=2795733 RepID=UPI001F48435A|nr:dihydrofolate reductase family protein [Qaidamihabitans albus]